MGVRGFDIPDNRERVLIENAVYYQLIERQEKGKTQKIATYCSLTQFGTFTPLYFICP